MDFPFVQFLPSVPAAATIGETTAPGDAFADLIDALLESLADSCGTEAGEEDAEAEVISEETTPHLASAAVVPMVAQSPPDPEPPSPAAGSPEPPVGPVDATRPAVEAVATSLLEQPQRNEIPSSANAGRIAHEIPVPRFESRTEGTNEVSSVAPTPAARPVATGETTDERVVEEESVIEEPVGPVPSATHRPPPRPTETSTLEPHSGSPVPADPASGEAEAVTEVDRADLVAVVGRIEEWMERTGGVEPTTISVELPDPDGDLLVRVGLREGLLEVNVIRPGGEAPAWLIDQLDEALARHGFEMAGGRQRDRSGGEMFDRDAPVRLRPRRRPARPDGLWI